MNRDNPLWGSAGYHGELLMLGFEVAESTVARNRARKRAGFLPVRIGRHSSTITPLDCIPSMLFVRLSTISFQLLYGLVILRSARGVW